MTYQIVKNANGEVIAYGPNDGMYEPSVKKGEVLSLEDDAVAQPLIDAFHAKLDAERIAGETAKASAKSDLLKRLGITAEEAALLLG
jgi:hypothetical protein